MTEAASKLVEVHIPESIEPLDRGEIYEDPLQDKLEEEGLGKVVGGGSAFDPAVGVTSVDIEVELTDLERGVSKLVEILEELGVPKGTTLRFPELDIPNRKIGKASGVALVLDGVNLPPEAYSDESQASLFEQIGEALLNTGAGRLHGSRSNNTHSSFFIYGPDREAIRQALQPIVASHPLCQNSVLEDVADADGA